MSAVPTAAARASAQVAEVRDSPTGRRALALRIYGGPHGYAPDHLPFRRAQLAFIDWQLRRGVLEPLNGRAPGSAWWREVNERLLRDQCEAVARSGGLSGSSSSPAVGLWTRFIDHPDAESWYRAHNASIVAGYLAHTDLALEENETERFFLNVVLLRVLFAHALTANPQMAVGWLRPLAPLLGDPRVRMTGLFLSITRVLPQIYPLTDTVDVNARREHTLGRLLDYGIIGPRLPAIYDWSATVLNEPGLRALIGDGGPCYALAVDGEIWNPARPPRLVRAVRRMVPARGLSGSPVRE